ncbi:MAG: protein kinase [Acidobacteriia bacterium]|nr:protein kinase [Terriglobia bacterium]
MQPERWRLVQEIVEIAIDLKSEARAAYVDEACSGDEDLRWEVESLLAWEAPAARFIEAPAMEALARSAAADNEPAVAERRSPFGPYKIVEPLGQGGMGIVYRALDTRLGRNVAIKVLNPRWQASESARCRLFQEARLASQLNHAHICTVHEIGEHDGLMYIVMELVEGRPLANLIPAGGLSLEAVLRFGAQVADALEHAHQRGIVHSDLKSANVMVTPEGNAKVLDFGLAKRQFLDEEAVPPARTTLSQVGVVAGTLCYMAPELLRGEPSTTRSDLWALGVVLYEAATGRLPFREASPPELGACILRDPPQEFPAAIPAGLRAIILRCLEKDPANRFSSAGEVRGALLCLGPASSGGTRLFALAISRRRLLALAPPLVLLPVAGGILLYRPVRNRLAPPRTRVSTGAQASNIAEANEYFEKGLHFLMHQYDLSRGRSMLERALQLDPHFAEARAYYGFSHVLMLENGYSNDTGWLYKAEEEIQRALQDDPNSARAYSALAAVYAYQGRKELVSAAAEKAMKINPREFDAYNWLGNYHWLNGDYPAAQTLMRKLIELDPLFFPARMNLGDYMREQGDIEGAIREQEKVLEQDAENYYALLYLARAYMDKGDLANAGRTLDRVRPADRRAYQWRLNHALLLALERRSRQASQEMDAEVVKFGAVMPNMTCYLADFYSVQGDAAQALEWLDRAVRNGDERVAWFYRDPMLARIRTQPRFRQITETIAYRRQHKVAR